MTGLILKDIYTMLKQTKLLLLFIVVIGFLQDDFILTYGICYASMLPITVLGYDERAKWNKLADMLPYTTNELVGSKYILGALSVGAAAFIMVCIKWLHTLTGKAAFSPNYWVVLLLTVCTAFLLLSVNLPFMFWIGVERGRLLFVIFVVAVLMFAVTALDHLEFIKTQTSLSPLILAAPAATAIILLISFQLSKIAYKHS